MVRVSVGLGCGRPSLLYSRAFRNGGPESSHPINMSLHSWFGLA